MEYTGQIVANVFEQATHKNCGLRLECVWPCTTSTTNDFTSTSFLSFSHPNFPFLCVAGSYAMSECTGSVLANGCVNCNGLGIWKGSTMFLCRKLCTIVCV